MRFLIVSIFLMFSTSVFAGEPPVHIVVHLLDPRGAIDGSTTLPTEWNDAKADVLGFRILNASESQVLRPLLTTELADDDNVPFCGHSPGYSVTMTESGKPASTVTLCATCGTWARNGELRALHGKNALKYLDELLPVPKIFLGADGKPAKILDPFNDSTKVPFRSLNDQ